MKTLKNVLIIIAIMLVGCQSSDNYKELPGPIANFVSHYWPNPDVLSYSQPTTGTYQIVVKNGPTITFNSDYLWTEINGNGLPLPQVLQFDQLPDPLYRYLESGEYTGEVFRMERTARLYTVELLTDKVTYNTEDGNITQSNQ